MSVHAAPSMPLPGANHAACPPSFITRHTWSPGAGGSNRTIIAMSPYARASSRAHAVQSVVVMRVICSARRRTSSMAWKIRLQRPVVAARAKPAQLPERLQGYLANGEAAEASPFKGITVDGQEIRALFPLTPTGVPTESIRRAGEAFVAALTAEQKERALFPLDTSAWRQWSNIHPWIMRHGIALDEMNPAQRDAALALLTASLSDRGGA